MSIDFQRRDLLATPVACPAFTNLDVSSVDLRRAWAGRIEYRQDRYLPLYGSAATP